MSLFGEAAALTGAVAVMLIGLVGIILPVIPGLALIWLGILGFALAEGFAKIDLWAFLLLTFLALVGVTADIWMSQLGAKLGGASFKSQLAGMAGGALGAILGLILGGVTIGVGAVLGSIIGVLAAEYGRFRDWGKALKSGVGWGLGWLAAIVVQLVIGGMMIAIFLWQVFQR